MASLGGLTHQINSKSWVVELPVTRKGCNSMKRSRIGFQIRASQNQTAEPDLSVTVNGLKMPNPFVIGSGPPGTNLAVMRKAFDEGWGAVIAKTV